MVLIMVMLPLACLAPAIRTDRCTHTNTHIHVRIAQVPTELKIGLEIDGPDAFGALLGAETAIATINAAARSGDAEAVLSNITLVGVLYQRNATVDEADVVQQAVADGVLAMVTFLGSDASIKLSRAAEAHRLPVLSSYATLSALSSPTLFPFFARPIPPDSQQGVALVDLCRKYRWLHVATVHDPSSGYSVGLESDFVSQTNDGGIQVRLWCGGGGGGGGGLCVGGWVCEQLCSHDGAIVSYVWGFVQPGTWAIRGAAFHHGVRSGGDADQRMSRAACNDSYVHA